ncbi:MAG: DUF1800 family protein [Cyclobacteriaceae bacterium]|nr:DUF1800 family protein [Cyclobacteriaceae bacterium]
MPLPPFAGTLGPKRAAHLLRRASFGPNKDEIDSFAGLTAAQAVSQLFQLPLPTPLPPIDPETGTEWMTTGVTGANSGDSDLQEFFKGWYLAQMLSQGVTPGLTMPYSVREKIVFFLHTVFTTIQTKVDNSRSLYFQNQLFRMFAFDRTAGARFNFKELSKKICVDNAMLRLLDGNLNVKGSPNENYAREFHELYTIGRGLEGTLPPITDPGDYFLYRETDVQAAAKVLGGWDIDATFTTIDPDTLLPRGKVRGSTTNASGHDNTIKQFSDRFANAVIQPNPTLLNGGNATEASALDEISQLVEQIYAKPETALNICRRVYRHYVYHDITPALDTAIISVMADTFRTSGFKIQSVLEDLFQSQHFYDAAAGVNDDNFGGIIKSPLDLMIGTMRFFEKSVPDPQTSASQLYEKTSSMVNDLTSMGMHFYEPFDVAGYDAYHQYPIYHRSWISTNYLTNRYDFIRQLVSENPMMAQKIDVVNFVRIKISNATASNAKDLIIELAKYLLPVNENLTYNPALDDSSGLTAERMNYFLTAFLKSPQIDADPEGAWTFRWNNPVDPEVVTRQLESLFNAMMQSPEYQLF